MAEQEYLILEWEDIYRMCIELSKRIKEDDFKPDVIVGVARGGWIPARILSDLLENTNLANIKAEFYEDVAKTGKKPRITQPVSTDV
ncbi:MAG: phosphoribosyltransferase family protein, partial [Candidatus Bathyarchaeia archaeon]